MQPRSRLLRLTGDGVVQTGGGLPVEGRKWPRVAVTAAVVGVVGATAVLVGRPGGDGDQVTAVAAVPAASASPSDDGLDRSFRVTAPELYAASGPAPAQQPPCRPGDVTAAAVTRPSAEGVVGVVTLTGDHCGLHLVDGPTGLRFADGQEHAVARDATPPAVDPGRNTRPDIPLANGSARWGFAWSGSWCGPAATAVVLPMSDAADLGGRTYGELVVPLTGPSPACTGGSDAVLVPGTAGGPAEAVLPPPAGWSSLHAELELPPRTDGLQVGAAVLALSAGDEPVTLDPCPEYSATTSATSSGLSDLQAARGSLACPAERIVIAAHGRRAIPVPGLEVPTTSNGVDAPPAGTSVEVSVGIAGVAAATATTAVG